MDKEIKIRTKAQFNVSINKILLKNFNELSKQKALNKSRFIELAITEWINKNK
jgi:metal-responsive CopG/Arc/MetJ family transcriptional regulator